MTRQELLSAAKLRLQDDLQTSQAYPDRILMRSPQGRHPLVLLAAEARLLRECFATPATAASVLVSLLRQRRCPPLNGFYELILQAHAAGVLVEERGAVSPSSPAWNWRLPLPPTISRWIGSVGLITGVALLPFRPWQLPQGLVEWLVSIALASASLSVGEVLAASTLRASGCAVRRPRRGRVPRPWFEVDSAEAVMGGPRTESAVAAVRAAPIALVGAALAWSQPGWLLGPLLAFLWLLRPWGDSAAMQWLRARLGTPHLSVPFGELLLSDANITAPRRSNWIDLSPKGRMTWMGWAVAWGVSILAAFGRFFSQSLGNAVGWLREWWQGRSLAVVVSVIAAVILGAGLTWLVVALRRWNKRRHLQRRLGGKRSPITRDTPLTAATIVELLRQFVVLQELSDEDRAAIASAVQPLEMDGAAVVFEEDAPADAFYFVVDGELEIQKRLPGRFHRRKVIGILGAGDSFGEIALLEDSPRTATVRSTRRSRLLRLSRDDFDRLMTQRVGAAKVREVLQNTAFLGRLVQFAGWSFDDLARFARRCASQRFEAGATVLKQGRQNGFFYIVYDGVLEERDGGKTLRRLVPGDYFGEDSLIKTNAAGIDVVTVDYYGGRFTPEDLPAVSDVVAIEESRCLVMPGADFLDFFASDFRVSVRMAAHVGHQ